MQSKIISHRSDKCSPSSLFDKEKSIARRRLLSDKMFAIEKCAEKYWRFTLRYNYKCNVMFPLPWSCCGPCTRPCNQQIRSLLLSPSGLPSDLIGCLDRRFLCSSSGRHILKYSPVSACMRDVLHWLPSFQRIIYRIAALAWRSLTGNVRRILVRFL